MPYLIVDQEQAAEPHVGTRDLDLGLALAVLDGGRYEEISESLRREGFKAMVMDDGGIRRPTWVLPGTLISIDFLICHRPRYLILPRSPELITPRPPEVIRSRSAELIAPGVGQTDQPEVA